MAEVLKTNNMSRRAKGSGFKMKSSPAKQGILSDFFGNLGSQLRRNRKDIGAEMKDKYSRRAQRADRVPRPGESKYQFDVRTRKARKVAEQHPLVELPATTTLPTSGEETPEVVKEAQSKSINVTGAIGSKTRKEQYDAKGWKYDETIKGYNRDGSRKRFVVQTSVTENDQGVLTPNTTSFNTKEEQDAFIAKNEGSFGYKVDKAGNRIYKERTKKEVDTPPVAETTKETKKKASLLGQILKPGFLHAYDAMKGDRSSPETPLLSKKKSPYKRGIGNYKKGGFKLPGYGKRN